MTYEIGKCFTPINQPPTLRNCVKAIEALFDPLLQRQVDSKVGYLIIIIIIVVAAAAVLNSVFDLPQELHVDNSQIDLISSPLSFVSQAVLYNNNVQKSGNLIITHLV